MKKIFVYAAGFFFIFVGIAGILLPILPGWVFIFLGLSMIAPVYTIGLIRNIKLRFLKPEIIHWEEWKPLGVDAGFTSRHFPLFLQKTGDLTDPVRQERFLRFLQQPTDIILYSS